MASAAHSHAVQFYESDEFLVETVANFLADGFRAGRPAVVIATDEHRQSLAVALSARGSDAGDPGRRGMSRFLDAQEMLNSLLVNGMPDRARFENTVGRLVRDVAAQTRREPCAYGEMVSVLWDEDKRDAALALEDLWNAFAQRERFELLCGYGMGGFGDAEDAAAFKRVCDAHTHVHPTEMYGARDERERLAEISQLQQRARALEAELVRRVQLEQE